jgi:hypothetical protein
MKGERRWKKKTSSGSEYGNLKNSFCATEEDRQTTFLNFRNQELKRTWQRPETVALQPHILSIQQPRIAVACR